MAFDGALAAVQMSVINQHHGTCLSCRREASTSRQLTHTQCEENTR
ncbi:hypothetical protein [Arthrobacter methylotrophus]